MTNYQQGKIYKIISPHTDKIYIGSTCKEYLSQRLAGHKNHFKLYQKTGKGGNLGSYELLQLGDVEIILIESYPCNTKDELTARERHWYDLNKVLAVNKYKPSITYEEKLKNHKELHIQNRDKELEQMANYRENNYDAIKKNKDSWYQENKNRLKEKNSIKYTCECGSEYTHQNKSRHLKSKIHINLLLN